MMNKINKPANKEKRRWGGRTKDLRKEKLILDYYYQNPDTPYRAIAEAVGVAEVTAYKTLRSHGLIKNKEQAQHDRRIRHEKKTLDFKQQNPLATLDEIAEAVGLATSTVRKILSLNNIEIPRKTRKHRTETNRIASKRAQIINYKLQKPKAAVEEIAKELNFSPSYIYTTLRGCGLIEAKRKSWKFRKDDILTYKKENPSATLRAIAEATGFSSTTVRQYLAEHGESTARESKQKKYERQILEYKTAHPYCPMKEIAEYIGVSVGTVRCVLVAHNLNYSALQQCV